MAEVDRIEAPRAGTSHVDIRFDVERTTAITAQWNVDRTHLIVSFGDFEGGLRLMLRPHAARRLQDALERATPAPADYVRA